MANKNKKWFNEFSTKYGVQFQVVKGNDKTIHVALIEGKKYTALAQLNKAQTEELFKNIANKTENAENTITVTQTGKVSINGTRYDIIDVIRGIKVKNLLEVLDKAKKTVAYYDFCNWLLNDKNRREYLKTIENNSFFEDYLTIEYFLQTGEVKAISDYNRVEALDMIAHEWAEDEGVELIGV